MGVLLQDFKDIAPYLMHPLVLGGFVLLLFFGLHRTLLKAGIIPPLSARTGGEVVQMLLRYGFVVALVVIVLGFALQFYKTHRETQPSKENAVGGHSMVREPDEDGNFTEWANKTVEFDKAPASVKLCRTAREVFVEVDAVQRQFLVDGKPFAAGDVRVISNTCKVTSYSLTEPRKWQSGGKLQVMYREKN